MLSAPFLATTYAISETGFLPLFFRIPWKSRFFCEVEFVFKSFVATFVVSFVETHRQEPAC